MELFAENTEAFFGRNDFFPFDGNDLRHYDRDTYLMIAELWGGRSPRHRKGDRRRSLHERRAAGANAETKQHGYEDTFRWNAKLPAVPSRDMQGPWA